MIAADPFPFHFVAGFNSERRGQEVVPARPDLDVVGLGKAWGNTGKGKDRAEEKLACEASLHRAYLAGQGT